MRGGERRRAEVRGGEEEEERRGGEERRGLTINTGYCYQVSVRVRSYIKGEEGELELFR